MQKNSLFKLSIRLFILPIITLISYQTFANVSKVAIIIDDMGYRYTDKQALTLPGDITYSFLPHTTYGKNLAKQAHSANHDILIHIPMESTNRKKLGPGAITSNMNEDAVKQSLKASFAEIPFAIGINNHMGSYLTQLYQPMSWTMDFLKQNNLFFLDSKTSASSMAEQAAIDNDVPVKSRHIFLDNELTESYIKKQFDHLIRIAQKHDSAIAIAHPHPETIEILNKLLPTLAAHDIELVPLSLLYKTQSINKIANAREEPQASR